MNETIIPIEYIILFFVVLVWALFLALTYNPYKDFGKERRIVKNTIGYIFDFIEVQLLAQGINSFPNWARKLANLHPRRITIYGGKYFANILQTLSVTSCHTAREHLLLEEGYFRHHLVRGNGILRTFPGGYVVPVHGDSGQMISNFTIKCKFLSEEAMREMISAFHESQDKINESGNKSECCGDERSYRN